MKEVRVKVPDMSCGHCVSAIQKAMEGVEGITEFQASLDMKTVMIRSDIDLDSSDILSRIRGAGYSPELIS